ncbi:hypothetical protein K438DRAFT_1833893 [Mycena galopus ATCC 62051]|nr:hypothetical protein K438DRAFT_1833893 [Mycena galopus ATCC 62051]
MPGFVCHSRAFGQSSAIIQVLSRSSRASHLELGGNIFALALYLERTDLTSELTVHGGNTDPAASAMFVSLTFRVYRVSKNVNSGGPVQRVLRTAQRGPKSHPWCIHGLFKRTRPRKPCCQHPGLSTGKEVPASLKTSKNGKTVSKSGKSVYTNPLFASSHRTQWTSVLAVYTVYMPWHEPPCLPKPRRIQKRRSPSLKTLPIQHAFNAYVLVRRGFSKALHT